MVVSGGDGAINQYSAVLEHLLHTGAFHGREHLHKPKKKGLLRGGGFNGKAVGWHVEVQRQKNQSLGSRLS